MREVFPSQKRKLLTLTSSVLSKKYILYVNSSRTSGHLTQKLGLKKQNHTGDTGKNANRLSFNNASDWLMRLSPTATVPNFFVISAQGLKVNALPVSCSGFDVGKSSSFLVQLLLCKYFVFVYGYRTHQADHFPTEYFWNLSFPPWAWKAKTNSCGDILLSTTARRSSASFAVVICREYEELGKASKVSRRKIIAFVSNGWARRLRFFRQALKAIQRATCEG